MRGSSPCPTRSRIGYPLRWLRADQEITVWPRKPERFVSRITRETLALVLAGGRGTRLAGLTAHRLKPAVPFRGRFRIIDFALSSCVNPGIRQIRVPTQYMAHELIQHVQHGWSFFRGESGEFVEKPPDPPAMPGEPGLALASMGIYVFNTQWLLERLRADSADEDSDHDFGKNILPNAVPTAAACTAFRSATRSPTAPVAGATSATSTPAGPPTSSSSG